MATVIRMKRGGRTHAPYYRIVVMDSRGKDTGRVIDEVGIYHPCAKPEPQIEVKEDKVLDWLMKGAQPSDTARNIFSKKGIIAKFAAAKAGKEAPAEAAPAVAAEAAPAEEAPAEAAVEAKTTESE